FTGAHMLSTPAFCAIVSTLPTPRCRVRSKKGTLSEATVAWVSVQSGWHAALLELRTGPAWLVLVRPACGNSLVAGESQCESSETFWRSASARSYTLNEDPVGCWPKPTALPSAS